jgi:UDP-GlcNAc:undecaprenyl-phosphate GlcNAc-1-phosphate transferase
VPQGSSWFIPIIVLGYPIFDTSLVVISRIRRREPIFKADCAHTYHRLVMLGLNPNRAVLVIHLTSLSLGVIGIFTSFQSPIISNIVFGSTLCIGIAMILFLERILWLSQIGERKSKERLATHQEAVKHAP